MPDDTGTKSTKPGSVIAAKVIYGLPYPERHLDCFNAELAQAMAEGWEPRGGVACAISESEGSSNTRLAVLVVRRGQ